MLITITNAILTAYCAGKCCTMGLKMTAAQTRPVQGITIAAPVKIPFFSKVRWQGQIFTVQDRKARRYRGRHWYDIYFRSHKDAKEFGIRRNQTLQIWIP